MKKIKASAKARLELAMDDSFPHVVNQVILAINNVSPAIHIREDSVKDNHGTWYLPVETRSAGVFPISQLERVVKALAPILKNTSNRVALVTTKGGFALAVEVSE